VEVEWPSTVGAATEDLADAVAASLLFSGDTVDDAFDAGQSTAPAKGDLQTKAGGGGGRRRLTHQTMDFDGSELQRAAAAIEEGDGDADPGEERERRGSIQEVGAAAIELSAEDEAEMLAEAEREAELYG
jgi:hypothetical protein